MKTNAITPPTETERAALCRAVANQIRNEPDRWDQEFWAAKRPDCGTVLCGAGWAVEMADGWRLAWDGEETIDGIPATSSCVNSATGEAYSIERVAMRLTSAPNLLFSDTLDMEPDDYAALWDALAESPSDCRAALKAHLHGRRS